MPAQPDTQSGPAAGGTGGAGGGPVGGSGADPGGESLLAALLDGMDAALCAFDAAGVVTHWNREAERILGWTSREAVGRKGLSGWAVRSADAQEIESRLLGAMTAPGRQVHEFALVTKDGGRVLVRTQSSGVRDPDGRPAGVYCAFSEVHTQIDLERSIALSEALFDDASWGVVLLDADLRPAVSNTHAARALGVGRAAMLGRPLGDLIAEGVDELEGALQHVLAAGTPPAPADLWVTLRTGRNGRSDAPGESGGRGDGGERRCWRSGMLRLASPLTEEPVPLGVAWLFHDITDAKRAEQEASRVRFRDTQLHRAARAAAECEDPREAAALHLDFALAGFADHALLDLSVGGRLVRAARTPSLAGPCPPAAGSGIPVRYMDAHPALQALERCGSVRTSVGGAAVPGWAAARSWPEDAVHGMCSVLRSRGHTLGVVTFLRTAGRRPFDRSDAMYAEDVAVRVAASVDLAETVERDQRR
ncbi:PAS domain-containing protein [Streptomyces sp. 549]|uniref:PAS domain-containing protein n=1 Tax=Streptomyces sp. 549 TaxID=3049076 RepID=UPI0024C24671|nr:PAS domain-containing protein [Streptomyces sp. 549]MDK1472552.1 PAS domain-containing protein [Streptomyces sp. 549]